jgi:hypothetical protein
MHDKTKYQGIHLVTSNERHVPEQHPNTRLMLGDYFADIMIKRGKDICYWVIQQIGSADVVDWGNAADFETAQKLAQRHLEQLVRDAKFERKQST